MVLSAVAPVPATAFNTLPEIAAFEGLAQLAKPIPPVPASQPTLDVHRTFTEDPDLFAMAVVDDHRRPIGIVNRFRLLEQLSRPFVRELFKNQTIDHVMDGSPLIVDEYTPLDHVSGLMTDSATRYIFDGFIVTREGLYLGIGTGYDLMRQITERRQTALAHLAYYDVLTGLPNRRLFHDRLQQALASATRHHRRLAVLYLDLDRFKSVNDELGHGAGDQLLQRVADRFRTLIRAQDTAARLSGDEFAFVVADLAEPAHADLVAQKLVDLFQEPFVLAGQPVSISASVGIALYPDHSDTQGTLLQMADRALYRAKRTRNAFQRYAESPPSPSMPAPMLFTAVRRALALSHLDVHYQPQVLLTGRLAGIEALVRWQDPDRGRLSTVDLIRCAEESGLIGDVTDFVCGSALRQMKEWRRRGLATDVRIAMNVSGSEVRTDVLAPLLRRHCRNAGLPLSVIDLEITETALMHSDAEATDELLALRGDGLRVSVDDFGTGYSSLARLHCLPVDALKIDRSFVDRIGRSARESALARAVIAIAHSLDLTVTAEGVETEAQRAFLMRHGCDRLQGYLLAAPMPAAEMSHYLARAAHLSATPAQHLGCPAGIDREGASARRRQTGVHHASSG